MKKQLLPVLELNTVVGFAIALVLAAGIIFFLARHGLPAAQGQNAFPQSVQLGQEFIAKPGQLFNIADGSGATFAVTGFHQDHICGLSDTCPLQTFQNVFYVIKTNEGKMYDNSNEKNEANAPYSVVVKNSDFQTSVSLALYKKSAPSY